MDLYIDDYDYGSHGHVRTNEFIGKMPIKEAIKKQNVKIASKKIVLICKWFWNYDN